jgi:hypothetical protein
MLVYILIGLVICALFGCQVAEQKQAGNRGFWLGLFMGPAGVIAAGFMDGRPQCARCGGRLNNTKQKQFDVCQYCGADLSADCRPQEKESSPRQQPKLQVETAGSLSNFSHLLHAE